MKKLTFLLLIFISNLTYSQLNIDHYIGVGETLVQIGNYVGAIENFNIVIRFKPHLPEPYYFRAVAKHQLEDYRGAIQDYNTAINIKPYYPDAFMNRGLAYLQLNEYTKAIEDYNRAIELDPGNSTIYNNRGIAKVSMKDIDGAIADYDKALELNPKFTNSFINRSNARLMKNDIKGAIKDLNQAIIIRPHYSSAYLLRGLARFELNDYASALRDFDQCLKLDPKNANAYNNRGIVKQKLEDFKAAISDYNLALQIDPTLANAYMNRGIAKEALKLPGSEADFAVAAKLDPKLAFKPKEEEYLKHPLSNQKAGQTAQPNQASNQNTAQASPTQPTQSAQTNQPPLADKKNADPNSGLSDPIQNSEQKKETKEERDRRRYRLALADERDVPSAKEAIADDGRIQNKNIVIDLQPIFVLSSYNKFGSDYIHSQYYNLELETINNLNNYNPVISISNQPANDLKEIFRNNILFFNEKIRSNSNESLNFLSRGIFYFLDNDYARSLNDLKKSIDLNDKNLLAYFARANCQMKMTDQFEQIRQNSDAIKIPLKNDPKKNKDIMVETVTDYNDILNDYATCISLNPNFAFAWFNQSYVKCKLHNYEGALADLNKAIDIEKDFAEAYFNRGLTKIYLDDVEGGAMDLSKAGELGIQDAYNIIKRYCN
ncbi:MAG: tetratricopeptide repeat protein [Bacteroidia bacterium]|jgi:tetratricopeptide (TPR) repeat protein